MSAKPILNFKNIRLVTFDITGTLLQARIVEPYSLICLQHGVPLKNEEKLAANFKQKFLHWSKKHPNFGKYSGLGWNNWWKNIVADVLKEHNSNISDDKLEKIATTLIKQYSTKECWQVIPGTTEVLKYLNSKQIVVGVISNFDTRLNLILTSAGLRNYFSFVITSYEHGKEKPDISIFQEALRLAKNISGEEMLPNQALHIGDNLNLDYNGAKNAGWNAFLMTKSDKQLNGVSSSEIFENLTELQNFFVGHI